MQHSLLALFTGLEAEAQISEVIAITNGKKCVLNFGPYSIIDPQKDHTQVFSCQLTLCPYSPTKTGRAEP